MRSSDGASRLVLGLGRRDTWRLEQGQNTVVGAFAGGGAHGGHAEVGALEQRVQVAALEDEAVEA